MTLIEFDLTGVSPLDPRRFPEEAFHARAMLLWDDPDVPDPRAWPQAPKWVAWGREAWYAGVEDPDETRELARRAWVRALDAGELP